MKCSAEAKIFCFYDAQMSHKHHRIQSPSTVLSWGHADFPGSGCWNGWAETKSVQGEQLGGRHFSAASAQRSLQYGALLLTEITDTKNQMMPVACTLDILNFSYFECRIGSENDRATVYFCCFFSLLVFHQSFQSLVRYNSCDREESDMTRWLNNTMYLRDPLPHGSLTFAEAQGTWTSSSSQSHRPSPTPLPLQSLQFQVIYSQTCVLKEGS